jgi:hypothetical protein
MIKRLEYVPDRKYSPVFSQEANIMRPPSNKELMDKINEIIDYLNAQEKT